MPEATKRSLQLRALLTDTLPYEVPVIFSNDRWHAGLSTNLPSSVRLAFNKLSSTRPGYAAPYNYSITKDRERRTTLSIVHPLIQVDMARFYELHGSGMLSHCGRGDFSLRRPVALASPFSTETAPDDDAARSGIPQLLASADEPDPSHMTSYFVYGKYNLLGKFISSREYIRLEERHSIMRTIDVSKCFYNIYTHSITWAVKSKSFAKIHKDSYSFESAFDKLMQRSNYNETNGIVVGPEISRVFAEIILQDIDDCVRADLSEDDIVSGRHYDIRRYVDDYFVFANDTKIADRVEKSIRYHLERYKLYANEKKIETYQRPFVSPLSIARDSISSLLREVSSSITGMVDTTDAASNIRDARALRAKLNRIRLIVAQHGIQFANLSGWLLSRLRRIVSRCAKIMGETPSLEDREPYSTIIISALETALYICAVDLRVRTTYALCQLAQTVFSTRDVMAPEQYDLATHLVSDSLANLIRRSSPSKSKTFHDNVELYNLLICGAHFVGEDFLTSAALRDCVDKILETPGITYFAFITLKFCLLKRPEDFLSQLNNINSRAKERLERPDTNIWTSAEDYLLAVDFLSSPDVSREEKRPLFTTLFGHEPRLVAMDELGTYAGFADWSGLSVEHQLRRKALRPVYAWT